MTAAQTICRMGSVENPRDGEMYPGTPSRSPTHMTVMTPRMIPPVCTNPSRNRPELVTT